MRLARLTAMVSVIGILLGMQSAAFAQTYGNDSYYYNQPTYTAPRYYAPRYTPSYYDSGTVTRGEFVQMVSSAFGVRAQGTNCFRDVGSESYAGAICGAKAQGIVSGTSSGYFRPGASISLVEAGAIVVRAAHIFPPSDYPWYRPYLQQLAAWNAVPQSVQSILDPLSRSQASELISLAQTRGNNRNYNDRYYGNDYDMGNDVNVVVTAPSGRVRAGDIVSYKIAVHSAWQYSVTSVQALLDSNMTFVSASRDGYLSSSKRVTWDDIGVRGDGQDTLTVRVRIDGVLQSGDTVKLRVTAGNGSDTVTTRIYSDDYCDGSYGDCYRPYNRYCRYTGDLNCINDYYQQY